MQYHLKKTQFFEKWFKERTPKDMARIGARLNRIKNGNFGDSKHISGNIHELRFKFGSGFRIYFKREGRDIILLLVGGDKSSQSSDIAQAKKISKNIGGTNDEN